MFALFTMYFSVNLLLSFLFSFLSGNIMFVLLFLVARLAKFKHSDFLHDTLHIGGPSQGVRRRGPMRGLGSGHVTCGPMRGLEINFTGRGHTQTDVATL